MKYGEVIENPLIEGICFVDDDPIADRVKLYDEDSRLAVDRRNEDHLLIVRFARGKFAPGGMWIPAFRGYDVETREPLLAPPDDRILVLQRKYDTHRRNDLHKDKQRIETYLARAELQRIAERSDRAAQAAEIYVNNYRRLEGQKRRIFVP